MQRSFYFWRSNLSLSSKESSALQTLGIRKLYAKFFDVVWNDVMSAPTPVAMLNVSASLPDSTQIVPVVFVTNEVLQKIDSTDIDSLSFRVIKLVTALANSPKMQLGTELQIDCDWTASTKNNYFRLLSRIKQNLPLPISQLSATIRLHQLKYKGQTGVPPVDKGLLMCYNMGNLQQPNIRNSIFDTHELGLYIEHANTYDLPLDVGLPIFDWFVWFRGIKFRGLIHSYDLGPEFQQKSKTNFLRDTVINGYAFSAHDWIRYENSDPREVMKGIEMIRNRVQSGKINVVLYHLDDINLNKISVHEMEDLFNGFD